MGTHGDLPPVILPRPSGVIAQSSAARQSCSPSIKVRLPRDPLAPSRFDRLRAAPPDGLASVARVHYTPNDKVKFALLSARYPPKDIEAISCQLIYLHIPIIRHVSRDNGIYSLAEDTQHIDIYVPNSSADYALPRARLPGERLLVRLRSRCLGAEGQRRHPGSTPSRPGALSWQQLLIGDRRGFSFLCGRMNPGRPAERARVSGTHNLVAASARHGTELMSCR